MCGAGEVAVHVVEIDVLGGQYLHAVDEPGKQAAVVEVERAEAVANKVFASAQALLQHGESGVEVAVADGFALFGVVFYAAPAIHRCIFEVQGEAEPAVVFAARVTAGGRDERLVRVVFGEPGDDGEGFGQHGVAVGERRDFAHWVDGAVGGRFYFCTEGDGDGVVVRAAFFQHPAHHAAA